MAIKRVQQGDLITADLINQIIDEVNRLSHAVASLGRKRRVEKVFAKKLFGRKNGSEGPSPP
jgi:primosomal protein N''